MLNRPEIMLGLKCLAHINDHTLLVLPQNSRGREVKKNCRQFKPNYKAVDPENLPTTQQSLIFFYFSSHCFGVLSPSLFTTNAHV